MARSFTVKVIAGCSLLAALGRFGVPAALAEDGSDSRGVSAAAVAASAALTVAHVPSKLAMCGASAVLGGFAYLLTFGRPSVAKDVRDTVKGVCTGPYVITPTMLETDGEEPSGSHGAK